jgi:toxin ParE1/3/4
MTYRIHITAAAVADTETISAYLAETSPQTAERVLAQLEKGINSLADFPKRYGLAPEAATHGKEVRQIVVGKYRVLFMVILETVNILRVHHVAQESVKPGELN